jgi:hypothetical protein
LWQSSQITFISLASFNHYADEPQQSEVLPDLALSQVTETLSILSASVSTVRTLSLRARRRRGRVELDGVVRIQIGPEQGGRSPGAPIRFYFRDGPIVNTDKCEVMLPDLQSKHSDSSAFFSVVEYNV